ncbi:MAG: O-antigen ligase family protein [Pseudomonadota bacterium]
MFSINRSPTGIDFSGSRVKHGMTAWLLAYAATLLLPLGLIFSRGVADGCCVAIGILFLWQSYKSRKWEWLKEPLVRVGLLAWAWLVLVVSPLAVEPSGSVSVALPWIRYIIMFAALKFWVLEKEENLLLLAKMLAFMLALVMIDTLWQYVNGVSLTGNARDSNLRLTGPMDGVKVGIFIAKFLLPAVIICMFATLRRKQNGWIGYALLLLIGEVVILLSGERTAFVSSLLGIFGALFILALTERYARIAIPFIAILFTVILTMLIKTQEWVFTRAVAFKDTLLTFSDTVYGTLFKIAYVIGEENWFNGVGLKGYRIVSSTMEDKENPYCGGGEFCNFHPHNYYLEWFAETGLFGVILFALMVVIMLVTALRYFRESKGIYRLLPACAVAVMLVNFFPIMVTQSAFSNWPAILLWYSVAVAFAGMNICKAGIRD